ncbi:universal stress protein [Salidesulfovibrio onnuriiensis]|uniref:universal stress protein n=1 Tax=Salidesulfovibrio onnuriiensis TaxID=2583823 RepID=UPI0011CB8C11|nr:universal stress protein [Salidesulfovibrio onnuriiensis]
MNRKLKILVSIGGGPEAYEGLAFAARLSHKECAETHFLTVREPDSGMRTGGMEMRVAREHVLGWGLELPGMRRLKKARDIFAELGEIRKDSAGEWEHRTLSGDPAGEYAVTYETPCGGTVHLHLRTGTDVPGLVANECDLLGASLVIVGAPGEPASGLKRLVAGQPLAYQIAARAPCPVIIARKLEASHGFLAILDDSDQSLMQFELLAEMARACDTPLTLASMAGPKVLDAACRTLPEDCATLERRMEIEPDADQIIAAGKAYSLLAIPTQEGRFRGSLAAQVAEGSSHSVMVMR